MAVEKIRISEMLRREKRDMLPQRSEVRKKVDEHKNEQNAARGNSIGLGDIHRRAGFCRTRSVGVLSNAHRGIMESRLKAWRK